jgi:acetyl esterase
VLVGSEWREETLAFNEQMRALMAQLPPLESVPAETTRRARREGTGSLPKPVFLPQARWEEWDGVRMRILAPDEPRGTYLHLHGGGWTLGGADQQDPLLWELAEAADLAVASVDYRLAPEHPTRPRSRTASPRPGTSPRRACRRRTRSAASRPVRIWRC